MPILLALAGGVVLLVIMGSKRQTAPEPIPPEAHPGIMPIYPMPPGINAVPAQASGSNVIQDASKVVGIGTAAAAAAGKAAGAIAGIGAAAADAAPAAVAPAAGAEVATEVAVPTATVSTTEGGGGAAAAGAAGSSAAAAATIGVAALAIIGAAVWTGLSESEAEKERKAEAQATIAPELDIAGQQGRLTSVDIEQAQAAADAANELARQRNLSQTKVIAEA